MSWGSVRTRIGRTIPPATTTEAIARRTSAPRARACTCRFRQARNAARRFCLCVGYRAVATGSGIVNQTSSGMALNVLAMVPHVRTLYVLPEFVHSDLIHSVLASNVRVMGIHARTMYVWLGIANTRSVKSVRRVNRSSNCRACRRPATVSANAWPTRCPMGRSAQPTATNARTMSVSTEFAFIHRSRPVSSADSRPMVFRPTLVMGQAVVKHPFVSDLGSQVAVFAVPGRHRAQPWA